MTTAASINIQMPRKDMAFLRQLAKRMGWSMSDMTPNVANDSLYDPETKSYLNEETMQAIRDVEAGYATMCNSIEDVFVEL